MSARIPKRKREWSVRVGRKCGHVGTSQTNEAAARARLYAMRRNSQKWMASARAGRRGPFGELASEVDGCGCVASRGGLRFREWAVTI